MHTLHPRKICTAIMTYIIMKMTVFSSYLFNSYVYYIHFHIDECTIQLYRHCQLDPLAYMAGINPV